MYLKLYRLIGLHDSNFKRFCFLLCHLLNMTRNLYTKCTHLKVIIWKKLSAIGFHGLWFVEPTFVSVSDRTLSLLSNSNLLKLWVKFCYYINIMCVHSQKQGSRNSDMNTLGFCSSSQAIVHWYAECTLWKVDLLVQLQSTSILSCGGHWLLSLILWISCYWGGIRFDCDFVNEGVRKDLIMRVNLLTEVNEKIV